MPEKHIPLHKKSAKGFSSQMAEEINRHQSARVQKKMNKTHMHPPQKGQGYKSQRSGVDTGTL